MGNHFQNKLLSRIEQLSQSWDLYMHSRFVKGETADYYIAWLSRPEGGIEVYIYADDAGFSEQGNWHMYERCDFDSPDQLIEALASGLCDLLQKTSGR